MKPGETLPELHLLYKMSLIITLFFLHKQKLVFLPKIYRIQNMPNLAFFSTNFLDLFRLSVYLKYLKIFSYDKVSNAQWRKSPTRATPRLSAHAMPYSHIHTHSVKICMFLDAMPHVETCMNVYMPCPM